MKKKITIGLMIITASLFFIHDFAKAQTTNENIPDTPPADATTYIIVDGPGRGTQIHANPSSTNFSSDINVTTQASGHLSEEDRCKGPQLHYHGSLNGNSDPAMLGCGWGHVIKFDDLMDGSQLITAAFMRELRAQKKATEDPKDFDGAIADLNDAIADLNELKSVLSDSMANAMALEEIDSIIMIDNELVDLVNEYKQSLTINLELRIEDRFDIAGHRKEKILKEFLKSEPAAEDLPRYVRGPRRGPRGPR